MLSAEKMRVRLGLAETDETQDALIGALIAEAEAYARAYCRMRPWETAPDHLLARMVQEDYGRLEGAGLSSRSVSGAAEYYLPAYSGATLSLLRALRHPAGKGERGC